MPARTDSTLPDHRRPMPESVAVYVTEQIRRRIVLGQLSPGQRLSMYTLGEEFGISRVPLREAMRQLEAEGLVDNVPRRGTVVRPLSMQDLEDCFQLLEYIESIAAKRAAKLANPLMVVEMRNWSDRMHELKDRRVSEEMLEAHRNFHFAFFDALGEGILLRLLRMLWHTCERYVMHCMPDTTRQEGSRLQHLELINLVEKGKGKAAAELLTCHIRESLEFSKAYLRREGSV